MSIITIPINVLTTQLKTRDYDIGVKGKIRKTHLYTAQKKLIVNKKPRELKWKDKNIYHINNSQKKTEMSIVIANKVDYRAKNIARDIQDFYIIMEGSSHKKHNNLKCLFT